MKNRLLVCIVSITILLTAYSNHTAYEYKTLPIGSPAPDFNLAAVDGKMYSLSSFKNATVLVVVFTCNHCPTAQAYEDRIIKLTSDYASKNVAVVAIMPNDPKSLRLDELDFSDLGDSFEEMKIRAKEKNFNFPYLYDGETESVSKIFGPIATPHVFIFDKDRKLRYTGRIDDMESPFKTPKNQDARNAIDAILNDKEVLVKNTKVFGCSIKWTEKRDLVKQSLEKWAKEPVTLQEIDGDAIKKLIENTSGKLRLINAWSVSNAASTEEFQHFVTINRMYRDRDFEFISINADGLANKENALQFLQKQEASNTNYLFNEADKNKLSKFVNPSWKGGLPYTILVEPGGKIIYTKEGTIDPAELKRTIVNDHLIGRYP